MTASPLPAPGTPAGVVLYSADPTGVAPFYGELLGWQLPEAAPDVLHDASGVAVAQLAGPGADGWTGWVPVLAAGEGSAGRVAAAAGRVLGPVGAGLLCADPTGAVFGLAAAAHPPLPPPGPARPVWFEVMTTDQAATDRFYQHVFGLPAQQTDTPEYALLAGPAGPVAGRLALPAADAGVLGDRWMVYLAHADVDAAAERVTTLGGTVVVPPRPTPTGRVSAVADPGGAVFTLLTPATPGAVG